jgi:hypothetical protein
MMSVPNIFCYLYHDSKNKRCPATQDGHSALRLELQGFLASYLKTTLVNSIIIFFLNFLFSNLKARTILGKGIQ